MPFDGPIPGENFTSDTKNYAWHRPPQHSDLDAAIEDAFNKLLEKNASVSVITMLELGVPAITIADMFCTSGIGAGKWTPDFALLMAGPITHIIYLMGKAYGTKVTLGIDNEITVPSASLFKEAKQIDRIRAVKSALGLPVEQLKQLAERQNPNAPADVQSQDNPAQSAAPQGQSSGFMGKDAGGETNNFMNQMGG